jgi:hypothetical protein
MDGPGVRAASSTSAARDATGNLGGRRHEHYDFRGDDHLDDE